jgi:hypothetical protein
VTALVDEDELRGVSEWREEGLKHAVVGARAAVQADNDRSVAHHRTIWDEPHSRDVEVEPSISNAYSHAATLLPLALPTVRASQLRVASSASVKTVDIPTSAGKRKEMHDAADGRPGGQRRRRPSKRARLHARSHLSE